ncbi:MAG: glycosyltransferase family 39 protein [Planctomycetota bacterium]|jgi:hypothetical protein
MSRSMDPRIFWLCAILILLVAAAMRIRYAGTRDALWRDEVFEIRLATESETVGEVLRVVRKDGQSPLHYLITRAVGRERALKRWHVLIPGWLTVLLLMVLARRWFGPRCALLCGLFAATSPFLIHYSAELRGYALYGLLTLVYFGIYLEFRDRRTPGWAIAWGAASALLAYCHYFGLFLVLVSGLLSLLDRPYRRSLGDAVLAGAIFVICFLPWMPALFDSLAEGGQKWAQANPDLRRALTPAHALTGRGGGSLLWSGIVLGAWVFLLGRWPVAERRRFKTILVVVLGSAFVGWLVQLQGGRGFITRYFIGHNLLLLPAALLYWSRVGTLGEVVVWRGLNTGRLYRIGPRAHAAIGLVFVLASGALMLSDEERWTSRKFTAHEDARRFLVANMRPGDLLLASGAQEVAAFQFHCPDLDIEAVPYIREPRGIALPVRLTPEEIDRRVEAFEARVRAHRGRVWLYRPVDRIGYARPSDPKGAVRTERLDPRLREIRSLNRRLYRSLDEHGERSVAWQKHAMHAYRLELYTPRDDS